METSTGTADAGAAREGACTVERPAGRPGRLPLPAGARGGRIYWRYAIPIVVVHVLALAALLPSLFSWTGLVLFLVGVPLYGQGINLVYHRLLAHRSFSVPRRLERAFVVGALCSLEDTPARWVATHRFHHTHSDQPDDPHSPLTAFLWAHVGWLLVWNPRVHGLTNYEKYARDVLEDRFYVRLEKGWLWAWIYVAHAVLYFLAGAAAVLLSGGGTAAPGGLAADGGLVAPGGLVHAAQFGASLVVWGVLLRTVVVWHITWSVNSVTHLFGYRNYETDENSRNNWLVGVLAAGEGWHNNHHHDPASASTRRRWWEVDVTYAAIWLLERLGLARDVVRPRHERRAVEAAQRIPR